MTLRTLAKFFIASELEGGEGKIAPESSFVAVEESAVAFHSGDRPRRVNSAAVVVTRIEVRVVVSTLQL